MIDDEKPLSVWATRSRIGLVYDLYALPCNAVLLVISNIIEYDICKYCYKENRYRKRQQKMSCLRSWQTSTLEPY